MATPTHWASTDCGDEQGQPFIWLHGWGQANGSFTRLADLLKDRGHHRLYDLPGFGDTPIINPDWGTADYADDLINQLPDKAAILIGHSFGCRVAVRLAHKRPDKVKALILIAGAGLRPERSVYQKLRASLLKFGSKAAGGLDGIFNTRLKPAYGAKFGSADYKQAGDLRTTLVKTVTEDLAPLAATIHCPVLLITGGDDTETPPTMAKRYGQLFPKARVEIVPGFGHLDILSRGVYQCDGLIRPFLDLL